MKFTHHLFSWFITITLPFVLIMFSIRVLFTPLFLTFEYNFPGFPADNFGFSNAERMQWGKDSMQYLFDRSGKLSLANLQFSNGSKIYNEREISHMLDVKILLLQSLNIFYLTLFFYAIMIATAWKTDGVHFIWRGFFRGGWFTISLVAFILAGIMINFDQLFTLFHKLFFTGDTWLFNYSDTLIRLFPIRLWQDAFIFMGIITLGTAVLFITIGKNKQYAH